MGSVDNGGSEALTLGDWRAPFVARCVNGITALAAAACFATLPISAIVIAAQGGSPVFLLSIIPLAPVAYLLLRASLNIWRARLTITASHVTVAGVTRTHRVPIDNVDHFAPALRRGTGAGTPMVFLVKKSGGAIGIYAFMRQLAFIWNDKNLVHRLDPAAAKLNEALARARESPLPG